MASENPSLPPKNSYPLSATVSPIITFTLKFWETWGEKFLSLALTSWANDQHKQPFGASYSFLEFPAISYKFRTSVKFWKSDVPHLAHAGLMVAFMDSINTLWFDHDTSLWLCPCMSFGNAYLITFRNLCARRQDNYDLSFVLLFLIIALLKSFFFASKP